MATLPRTDLIHIYRALKTYRDVIQESPELLNIKEHEEFLVAWEVVHTTQIEDYDYETE